MADSKIATMLVVALGFAVFSVALWQLERRRYACSGPGPMTLFVIIFLLQCGLPGVVIFGALPFTSPHAPSGSDFFDRVYSATSAMDGWILLSFAAWFAIFAFVGSALTRTALGYRARAATLLQLRVRPGRLALVLVAGTALTLASFYLLGDNIATRYANLILFRADFEGIEKNALNANALSLTQTWGWLSILAAFAALETPSRSRRIFWLSVLLSTLFAVLSASRRAIFIPILLSYLVLVLHDGKWRIRWLIAGAVPMLLWVAYGKDVLAAIAWGGGADTVAEAYQSPASTLLRASSEIGISIVESLGTLNFLHIDHRWGVDHLLSIAQRFPDGALGLDIDFPPRIVRLSTEAFAGANAQDIPPGVFGQMWLDFGVLGPVIWGLVLGAQIGVLEHYFVRTTSTLVSSAVFVIATFVVALPLNSGSFDFTFSVDIFVLIAALAGCLHLKRLTVESAYKAAESVRATPRSIPPE